MIENYFVMLLTHLKSLVGNIVGMTHAIFKIETNVKKLKKISNVIVQLQPNKTGQQFFSIVNRN
jgi:hypothetical protein